MISQNVFELNDAHRAKNREIGRAVLWTRLQYRSYMGDPAATDKYKEWVRKARVAEVFQGQLAEAWRPYRRERNAVYAQIRSGELTRVDGLDELDDVAWRHLNMTDIVADIQDIDVPDFGQKTAKQEDWWALMGII